MNKLAIPMESTRSRHHWRVLWIIALFLFTAGFAYLSAERFAKRRQTIDYLPENTIASLRIVFDQKSRSFSRTYLQSQPLFPEKPFTFAEILPFAEREMTIHFGNDTITGIALDQKLAPPLQKELADFGIVYHEFGSNSLISINESVSAGKIAFRPGFLHPKWNSELIVHEKSIAYPARLSENHLDIVSLLPSLATPTISVPPALLVSGIIPVSADTFLSAIVGFVGGDTEIDMSNIGDGTLLLGHDERGDVFYLNIPFSGFSHEQLASLGREMINRTELSTSALTLPDATVIQEIRSNPQKIRSQIQSTNDLLTISLANTSGQEVFIRSFATGFQLSNRDFFANITQEVPPSICDSRAPYFFSRKALNSLPPAGKIKNVFTSFPISEVSLSPKRIRFCFSEE